MPHDQQHPRDAEPAAAGVQLNHTVIHASDRSLSAGFLATLLGLEVGAPFGPFLPIDLGNGVTLDYYAKTDEPIQPQHYAFLVPDERFDSVIARLEAVGVTYYADPHHTEPGRINRLFGGRGAYFEDPDGHNMEVMTRPYTRP
ncbi:Glyoxalase/Bleomycin resistance protein/Dioxygenase superfamily protein [Streptomyces zhaozhouensis]|uniref:Glyoxalase/Bleomycin resistance protein/Dioxygenase superfamily protein n=1 Tax=Streptomyces zhaozhouensis TaxID=1300267 RepID=A0A286DMZ3_9ACTN|nr:VOC family protein [Streptomyces zhaozhouensis]SOD60107.1 Glyoxalase/Bleomycin resistance protein/Dioxygenase superfamily protein [Streptomyces zhaozhouensis]